MEIVYVTVGFCLATISQYLTYRQLSKFNRNSEGQSRFRLAKLDVPEPPKVPMNIDVISGGKIRNAKQNIPVPNPDK